MPVAISTPTKERMVWGLCGLHQQQQQEGGNPGAKELNADLDGKLLTYLSQAVIQKLAKR